jgi:hypothetical protein
MEACGQSLALVLDKWFVIYMFSDLRKTQTPSAGPKFEHRPSSLSTASACDRLRQKMEHLTLSCLVKLTEM